MKNAMYARVVRSNFASREATSVPASLFAPVLEGILVVMLALRCIDGLNQVTRVVDPPPLPDRMYLKVRGKPRRFLLLRV
jgi:hypothetical protein